MQQNHRLSSQTAVVTGASQGIGRAIAEQLAKEGMRVFGLSRTAVQSDRIQWIPCDVAQEGSVQAAFAEVFRQTQRVDILVNNAGMGIAGAAEFTPDGDMQRQFQVNVFGAVRCTQAALPAMRRQGGGKILFISSLASVFPIAFQSFYSMSKAALDSFSTALGIECKPFGIQTGTLLLGDVNTGFTQSRKEGMAGDEVYRGRIGRSIEKMERDEQKGMRPEQVAGAACRLLSKRRLPTRRAVGAANGILFFLNRILPSRTVLWVLEKLYG